MHQEYMSQNENYNEGVVGRFEHMLMHQQIGYFDVEEFENLVDYYLNHLKVKKSLLVVEEGLKQHPGSTVLLLCKARVLFKMGKYKSALRLIDKINYRVFDEDVLMLEGEVLLRLERYDSANDVFTMLVNNINEERDRLCLDIAFIYMGIQKIDIALAYLKKGLAFNSRNVEILFELALYSEENDHYDLAVNYYNQLLDIDSFNEEAWFNLGMCYSSQEAYDKAIEAFDYALLIDDKFFNAMFQKGLAYLRIDDYEEALRAFQRFLETDKYNDEVLIYLAECYEGIGDYKAAEEIYYRVLDEEPETYDAWIGLGYCKQSTRDYLESIKSFKKAIEIDENEEEAWSGMGESYFYAGLKEEAGNAFRMSLKLNPLQEEIWVMLVALRIENSELTEARSALNLAISIISDSKKLGEIKEVLDLLNGDELLLPKAENEIHHLSRSKSGTDNSMLIISKFKDRKHLSN